MMFRLYGTTGTCRRNNLQNICGTLTYEGATIFLAKIICQEKNLTDRIKCDIIHIR